MDIVNHNSLGGVRQGRAASEDVLSQENWDSFEGVENEVRTKTSNRMHYEAHVRVIRNQIGNLEEIRGKLGLSQRKICQLLMVDPSAWTRWQKNEGNPPPVIWRALQWYLIIQEKIPGLTPQYFVGKDPGILHQQAISKLDQEVATRQRWTANIAEELEKQNEKWLEQNESLHAIQNELRGEIFQLKLALKLYKRLFFGVVFVIMMVFVLSRFQIR